MGFDDAVDGALDILRRRGRVSYAALRRQFDLDDDGIAALRHELVDILGAADDERGELLTIRTAAPEPKAERRQLTVLAADLVGSTALSMRLDPEDLRELMHVYQTTCTRTIERLGGHVATWQGDGVFVLFGYPRAGEDDAIRAVTCGWEIVNDLGPARVRFKREHGISLAVRVGVHTGAVVVGDEGTTSAWQTHAFGGTPNIAARVAASADPDTVAVTESTRRLTTGYFLYEPIGTQKLKGVSQKQQLHRVTGPGKIRDRFAASLVRGLTPLVGRDRERAHLAEAAERARKGQLAAVLITGDPGIGKSRLVHYVRQEAVRLQQLHCQCSPYHRGTALHPVLEALRRRWGLEGEAQAQLAALRTARPDDTPRDIALLAAVLDLPVPPGSPPLGSPQRQRADTLDVLVALLRAEARLSPLVLVVEDVHWIDPSTIELLGALLASGRDVPLLLLLTARPEFAPPWGPAAGLELLVLDRLSPEHARELIGHVAPAATAEDIERLADGTDGVPLFAEEMTRAVLESDEGDIPTTLYGCLMARLDRDRATLTVAQVAAAIGREFGRDLLGMVCDLEPEQIDACLRELVDAQLLDVVPGPGPRFAFRHALIQETARTSLLRSTRQEYHGRIADVTLEHFPHVAEEQPEIVAQHLESAERATESVMLWMRAGQRAVQRSSNAEAILHLEHALELLATLPDDDDRARVELPLRVLAAVPLTLTRGWTAPAVEAHYHRARELCARVGDTPQLFPTLNGLLTYLIVSGQLGRGAGDGRGRPRPRAGPGRRGLRARGGGRSRQHALLHGAGVRRAPPPDPRGRAAHPRAPPPARVPLRARAGRRRAPAPRARAVEPGGAGRRDRLPALGRDAAQRVAALVHRGVDPDRGRRAVHAARRGGRGAPAGRGGDRDVDRRGLPQLARAGERLPRLGAGHGRRRERAGADERRPGAVEHDRGAADGPVAALRDGRRARSRRPDRRGADHARGRA